MLKTSAIVLSVLGSSLAPASARGQALQDTVLQPGLRVRVEAPVMGKGTRIGRFVSRVNDTLSVVFEGSSAPTPLALDQVMMLEASVERTTNIVKDADRGSHAGGWVGAAVGGIVGAAGASGLGSEVTTLLGFVGAIGGYFTGQLIGTAVGGAAGVVDRDDRWKPVVLVPRQARSPE